MAQQKKKKGGFFSSLSSAVDSLAGSVDKAAKEVSGDLANITTNPLDHIKPGHVIQIIARSSLKCFCVDSNGLVQCTGVPSQTQNNANLFEVVVSKFSNKAHLFRSVAYPQYFLAVVNGCFTGNGIGGPECDFYVHRLSSSSSVDINDGVTFESAMNPGSYVGVLPTGQFTLPAQTTPHTSNAAHMRVKYVRHNPNPLPHPPAGIPQAAAGVPPQPGVAPPPAGTPPQQHGPPPAGTPPQQHAYPGGPPQQGPPPGGQGGFQGYPAPSAPPPAI